MLDMEPVSLDFPNNLEGEKTWGASGAVTNSSAHQTIQNMQRIEHRKGRIIKVSASLCIFRQKRTRQTAQRRRARAGRPRRLRRRFHLHPRPPRHRPRHRPRRRQRRRQRCRQRCWQRSRPEPQPPLRSPQCRQPQPAQSRQKLWERRSVDASASACPSPSDRLWAIPSRRRLLWDIPSAPAMDGCV